MANQGLLKAIEVANEKSNGTYGSSRIYAEVKEEVACSKNRAAHLMKKQGLAAKQKGRFNKQPFFHRHSWSSRKLVSS